MATPSRLIFFNPSSTLVLTLVMSFITFFCVVLASVLIDDGQNQNLVSYEIKILLQNNGHLVEQGHYREFIQLVPNYNKFYISILNIKDKSYFNVGDDIISSTGVCSSTIYFSHEILFCKEKVIPWKTIISISVIFFVLLAIAIAVSRRSEKKILSSLKAILQSANMTFEPKINIMSAWYLVDKIAEEIPKLRKTEIEYEKTKITADLARQMAHDIRSPLSTLNLMSSSMLELSDEKRNLVRNSIQQINNIAYDLLAKASEPRNSENFYFNYAEEGVAKLKEVLVDVMKEKEIQNEISDIVFKTDLKIPLELSTNIPVSDFRRILSNLLNNSIESLDRQGLIILSAELIDNLVVIQVTDNGKGIPQNILNKLGKFELSYGKNTSQSGNGLGFYHAQKTIEKYGGQLSIYSKVNEGTVVNISFPTDQA